VKEYASLSEALERINPSAVPNAGLLGFEVWAVLMEVIKKRP
jgi:hypothetical protein